jgi:hypothetical protein
MHAGFNLTRLAVAAIVAIFGLTRLAVAAIVAIFNLTRLAVATIVAISGVEETSRRRKYILLHVDSYMSSRTILLPQVHPTLCGFLHVL